MLDQRLPNRSFTNRSYSHVRIDTTAPWASANDNVAQGASRAKEEGMPSRIRLCSLLMHHGALPLYRPRHLAEHE